MGSVLAERRPVEEAIIPAVIDSLDLLPCGPCPANPVELLNNGFFAELLDGLKGRYDKIVIDSPPVMPVADAQCHRGHVRRDRPGLAGRAFDPPFEHRRPQRVVACPCPEARLGRQSRADRETGFVQLRIQ